MGLVCFLRFICPYWPLQAGTRGTAKKICMGLLLLTLIFAAPFIVRREIGEVIREYPATRTLPRMLGAQSEGNGVS